MQRPNKSSFAPSFFKLEGGSPELTSRVQVNAAGNDKEKPEGNVKIDLVGGDKLTISTLEDGCTAVWFKKLDGTVLDLMIKDSNDSDIGLTFKDSVG